MPRAFSLKLLTDLEVIKLGIAACIDVRPEYLILLLAVQLLLQTAYGVKIYSMKIQNF
jgi:hypothetical protein